MKKAFKIIVGILIFLVITILSILFLYNNDILVLNPKGLIGLQQKELIITTTLLMLIVVIPTLIFTVVIAERYKVCDKNKKRPYSPNWNDSWIAETIWWGIPCIIIALLSVINWVSSHDLDPYKPISSDVKPVEVQVVALDWKWLFIFPDYGIASVNYFEVPEKTPIHFYITADAPMNSFWIPQLGGQIFAMPGMQTELYLTADEPGIFRGSSANLSGKGFAGMIFRVKATSDAEFQKWTQHVKQTGKPLGPQEYSLLAEQSENNSPAFYSLQDSKLFDQILMKYMVPNNGELTNGN